MHSAVGLGVFLLIIEISIISCSEIIIFVLFLRCPLLQYLNTIKKEHGMIKSIQGVCFLTSLLKQKQLQEAVKEAALQMWFVLCFEGSRNCLSIICAAEFTIFVLRFWVVMADHVVLLRGEGTANTCRHVQLFLGGRTIWQSDCPKRIIAASYLHSTLTIIIMKV